MNQLSKSIFFKISFYFIFHLTFQSVQKRSFVGLKLTYLSFHMWTTVKIFSRDADPSKDQYQFSGKLMVHSVQVHFLIRRHDGGNQHWCQDTQSHKTQCQNAQCSKIQCGSQDISPQGI